MANRKDAQQTRNLAGYLSGVWGRNLGLQGVERLDINGLEAATGHARVSGSGGTRDVRLLVVRGGREQIYRFAFIMTPSEMQRLNVELRRTTYSFRRLSDREAAAIQPLRIRVRPARTGETAAALADRYPFERFHREWFRLLNGLEIGENPVPGQSIKMVVE